MGERRCVVLAPAPFQGHITPMLQLASLLHAKGFSIVIVHTHYNAPDSSNHPEFIFVPLSDGLLGCDTSLANLLNVLSVININCRKQFQDYLLHLMENPGLHGCVCSIIYDSHMHFTADVANHLKLPTILYRVSSCAYFEAICTALQLHRENYFPFPESQLLNLVPKASPLRFKDLPFASSTSRISEPVVDLLASKANIRSSVAIIWNTTEQLEPSPLSRLHQLYRLPFFTIAPLHKMASSSRTSLLEEDMSCFSWLDTQAHSSVLYVSVGSLAIMNDQELGETAWGLANSNQPFLWVVRPTSVDDSKWMENLPVGFKEAVADRGRIVKWTSQKKVLAHVSIGGFWSHCGWNSTLESISEGIPMICRPFFGDQLVNTRYITHVWKVGLELGPELKRGAMEEIIRRLMVDDEGIELRQRALDLKERLHISQKDGGSSYNSINCLTEFISSFSLTNPQINRDL